MRSCSLTAAFTHTFVPARVRPISARRVASSCAEHDLFVRIDERQARKNGQGATDRGLPAAHEPYEVNVRARGVSHGSSSPVRRGVEKASQPLRDVGHQHLARG